MDPEAFWDELPKVLAMYGPSALNATNDVRRLLKSCVLSMWVDAADESPVDLERLKALTRLHISGQPKGGTT